MQYIDKVLNRITMYRLVVYVLGALVSLSLLFALTSRIPFRAEYLVGSLTLLIGSAYVTDRSLARFLGVPSNRESALITALILFFVIQPAHTVSGGLILLLAGAVSSAGKFLLAWNGKHIFNPAALAAAVVSLTGLQATSWWIGSSAFWPYMLVLGLLVVRKIRRSALFVVFVASSVLAQYLVFLQQHQLSAANMKHALLTSPLIFLASIMLTEPATMPPRRNQQMLFAVLVAVLYVTGWKLGPIIIYPEVALLLGNIFAFVVSPKFRVRLQLKEVQQVSDRVYNYVFQPDRRFAFIPGQYMEWTLPNVPYDSRGNRRTFTIASSPTEDEVMVGVKYYEPASTYKATLHQLKPGAVVYGSQLAGNFTMQGSEDNKLALIAGGIGITPFRSMVKYLTDHNLQSDVVLLYTVSNAQEFAYVKELKAASAVGVRTIPIVTQPGKESGSVVHAKLDVELLAQLIPDYAERIFYVSGPNIMVDATKGYLHYLGVHNSHIHTDHFAGY